MFKYVISFANAHVLSPVGMYNSVHYGNKGLRYHTSLVSMLDTIFMKYALSGCLQLLHHCYFKKKTQNVSCITAL